MIKIAFIYIFVLIFIPSLSYSNIDSLQLVLKKSKNDTVKIKTLQKICEYYYRISNDSVKVYCYKILDFQSNHKVAIICKAKSYIDLAYISNKSNNVSEEELNFNNALKLYYELGEKKELVKCYGNLANLYFKTSQFDKAIINYKKSLKLATQLNDKESIISNKINIGNVFKKLGKYNEALEHYMSALKLTEESKNEKLQAVCFNSVGVVHWENKNYNKAVEYFQQSLLLREKLKDKKGASTCYLNLGLIYEDQLNYDEAIINFQKSLKLKREVDDKIGISRCYNNIGLALKNKKDYKSAIEYYIKSVEIRREFDDKDGEALVLGNIANLYNTLCDSLQLSNKEKNNNYRIAIDYGKKSFEIAHQINAKPWILLSATALMYSYKKTGNYIKSNEFAEIVISYKDSMFSSEKTQAITEMDIKYQTEKKQLEIDNLEKQSLIDKKTIEVKETESKLQKLIIYSFIIGFILIIVFSIFLYRLFIQKKKAFKLLEIKNAEITQQKEEILAQRDEIENQRDEIIKHMDIVIEQKKEIEDSINYAKRIQDAILPISKKSRSILNEHFILFIPKDIVSGDFYWTAKVENTLVVVVADCTGHGVPGAFMSMLGISFLNEIVRKKEIRKASHVLNELRNEIIKALHQNDELDFNNGLSLNSIKDGMDISIIAIEKQITSYDLQVTEEESNDINHSTHKHISTFKAQWAGANNPLWIVRKGEVKSEKLKVESKEKGSKPDELSTLELDKLSTFKLDKLSTFELDKLSTFELDKLSTFELDKLSTFQLYELKGDKMPIAVYEKMNEFTNHEFDLFEGDTIYLMSDGYQDQFGGQNGKKFLSKNLKQLLMVNCKLSMDEQKQILKKTLIEWIGEGEQIDDITVVGIKI